MNTISIRRISGYEYQEIKYTYIDELNEKLINIIKDSNNTYIQLILNSINLNKFGMIDNSILSKLNKHDFITIIFIEKKEMYCLGNENGKYIMDFKKDNYYKLLEEIVLCYGNKSYDIIKNSLYKELVLLANKYKEEVLNYHILKLKTKKKKVQFNINIDFIDLKNDIDIILEPVIQNEISLNYSNKNTKEFRRNAAANAEVIEWMKSLQNGCKK